MQAVTQLARWPALLFTSVSLCKCRGAQTPIVLSPRTKGPLWLRIRLDSGWYPSLGCTAQTTTDIVQTKQRSRTLASIVGSSCIRCTGPKILEPRCTTGTLPVNCKTARGWEASDFQINKTYTSLLLLCSAEATFACTTGRWFLTFHFYHRSSIYLDIPCK